MKILVTGAAGFIGAHLTKRLSDSGHMVVAIDSFDNFYSGEFKRIRFSSILAESSPNIDLKIIDVNSKEFRELYIKLDPEAVIHLAAQAGVRLGLSGSDKYLDNNVRGFVNVAKCAMSNSTPTFLYASSSSVYGDLAQVPFSEDERTLAPKSLYGLSKLSNEQFASAIINKSQVRTRGLRFFSVYGPWGRPDMAYFRLAAAALYGTDFIRFGDGTALRDLTYIDDITEAIELLLSEISNRPAGFTDVVNIGGGKPKSLNQLVHLIEEIANTQLHFEIQPPNTEDSKITMADFSYLKKLTSKSSFIPAELGIENLLIWMRNSVNGDQVTRWIRSVL